MCEQNQPLGLRRDHQLSFKRDWAGRDLNFRNDPSHGANIRRLFAGATGKLRNYPQLPEGLDDFHLAAERLTGNLGRDE